MVHTDEYPKAPMVADAIITTKTMIPQRKKTLFLLINVIRKAQSNDRTERSGGKRRSDYSTAAKEPNA